MKPISVTLENIRPYTDPVTIPFQGPIMAIVGPNGTGKTTAIEAFFAGLYGRFPSRGNINGCIMPGATEAEIKSIFEDGGTIYTVTRLFTVAASGTISQRAFAAKNNVSFLGPNVGDVKAWIETRLGSGEIALATWFSAQGSKVGDLCDAQPAERRGIFAGLLGFGGLEARSKKHGEDAKTVKTKIEVHEARLGAERDWDGEIAACTSEIVDLGARHGRATADASIAQADIEAEQVKLATAGQSGEIAAGLRREAAAISARLREIEGAGAGLKRTLADLTAKASLVADYQIASEKAADTARVIATLEADGAAWTARQTWDRERTRLRSCVEVASVEVGALEGVTAPPEAVRLAAEGPAIKKELEAGEAEAAYARKANDAYSAERAAQKAEYDSLCRERKNTQARLDAKPVTPGPPEDCNRCPLLKDFAALPARIEEINARLTVIEDTPEKDLVPDPDLQPLRNRLADARAAYQTVKAASEAGAKLEVAKASLTAANANLTDFGATEPPPGRAVTRELADSNAALTAYERQAALLPAALEARAGIEEATQAVGRNVAQADAAADMAGRLGDQATKAEELAKADAGAIAEIQRAIAAAKTAKGEAEATARECRDAATRLEERVKRLTEDKAKDGADRAEVIELRRTLELDLLLREAFGKTGIQAILMDRAAPELEAISQDMLDRVTGGRMRMRLATQRANLDGSVAEDFLILISKEDGEGDIAMCSGGEQRMLRTILRLAIARWMGKLQGRRPTCLFVDEGFDALDAANRPAMVQLLSDLASDYELVVVVTHEPGLASQMPHRVTLERRYGSVVAEVA